MVAKFCAHIRVYVHMYVCIYKCMYPYHRETEFWTAERQTGALGADPENGEKSEKCNFRKHDLCIMCVWWCCCCCCCCWSDRLNWWVVMQYWCWGFYTVQLTFVATDSRARSPDSQYLLIQFDVSNNVITCRMLVNSSTCFRILVCPADKNLHAEWEFKKRKRKHLFIILWNAVGARWWKQIRSDSNMAHEITPRRLAHHKQLHLLDPIIIIIIMIVT